MKSDTTQETQPLVRILIADAHPLLRLGLKTLLAQEADLEVVGEATKGSEVIAQFLSLRPDLLLMDLNLPDRDGIAVIEAIREKSPQARILILTANTSDEDIYQALRAGAKGYLLKDAPLAELLEALRAIAHGKRCIPLEVAAKLSERMSNPELTEREMDVLRRMTVGRSNRQIARDLTIAEGTVKFHINNILCKLEVSDRTQAVTSALKRGLVRLD